MFPIAQDVPIPTLDTIQLGSIAGVMAATTIIVAMLTRLLSAAPFFKKIPMFVYVTLVAIAVTTFANKGLHTLTGSFWALVWQTAVSALGSSGFYVWLKGASLDGPQHVAGDTPPVITPSVLLLPLAVSLFFISGCVPEGTNGQPPTTQQVIAAQTLNTALVVGLEVSNDNFLDRVQKEVKAGKLTKADYVVIYNADQQSVQPLFTDLSKAAAGEKTNFQDLVAQEEVAFGNVLILEVKALDKTPVAP